MHTAYIQPPGVPPVKVCYIVTYKSCHILGALLQTYRIFGDTYQEICVHISMHGDHRFRNMKVHIATMKVRWLSYCIHI